MSQFADKLAPLAHAMGVPVPTAPAPSDPTAVSRAALDAVRNPLDTSAPLAAATMAPAPTLAPTPAAPLAPEEIALTDTDEVSEIEDDVPEMSEADFLATERDQDIMYGAGPDDGSDDEFGDGVDPDTAPDDEADDQMYAAPDYADPVFDDTAFGLGDDSADQIIEAAARDGSPVSLMDVTGDPVEAAATAGPFDAGSETDDRGPTLADVLAAQARDANVADELPGPVPGPRTDPVAPLEFEPEFITEETALRMAVELRERNDATLRTALLSILPQIYGAKTLTAENDVAIYITENAAFRDWLNAIFKKMDVPLTQSDRSIELGDGRIFLSRAPSVFDYRNAMMHLTTVLDRVLEKATALDQQTNGYNQLQARLIEAQQQLAAANRERDIANNTAARLSTEAERIRPVQAFRVHWTAKGKARDGSAIERPCFLVIDVPQDEAKHKPDGTFPLNAYDVSHNPDDAHSFKSLDVAMRTVELLRTHGQRIAQGKRNPFFSPMHLGSLHVVQWAHLVLPNKVRTV